MNKPKIKSNQRTFHTISNNNSSRRPKRNRPPRRDQRNFRRERSEHEVQQENFAHMQREIDGALPLRDLVQQTADALRHPDQYLLATHARPTVPDGFALDPWQNQALEALLRKENVVVDAPTTAGKTRVVEAYFRQHVSDHDFRACYTCPVKSLSNDKLNEFRAMFGKDMVGVATGDYKENLNAPIVVATLETYRNSLLGIEPDLGRKLVVFDEYHFIQDESRGSAWEEAMILTPAQCQILLLSASVANPDDFVSWLEFLSGRKTRLIQVDKRPVPLENVVWINGQWILARFLPKNAIPNRKQVSPTAFNLGHKKLAQRVVPLIDMGLTPCIVYVGKRLACRELAQEIANVLPHLSRDEEAKIRAIIDEVHAETNVRQFMDRDLVDMIEYFGVAFHHSGHAPPVRLVVERLVKNGLLRFCTATMGLSLGINFSVRSTLISDAIRPGEKGPVFYSPSEVLQMTGRAGRRGKDPVGYCLWPSSAAYSSLANPERQAVQSNLRNSPTTFLGLMSRGFSLELVQEFYQKSFLRFKRGADSSALILRPYLEKKISRDIPCFSPAHEIAMHRQGRQALCQECPYIHKCHSLNRKIAKGPLARLHLHLHTIGALDEDECLTSFGETALHFPQAGGLLIARMIDEGEVDPSQMLKLCQLLATVALARFKKPGTTPNYKFPYPEHSLEKRLTDLYPYDLFKDEYDPPWGPRRFPILREFNTKAGSIAVEWAKGASWNEVLEFGAHETFGPGDVSNLILRVASYLQSVASLPPSPLSEAASLLRESMLREPLLLD